MDLERHSDGGGLATVMPRDRDDTLGFLRPIMAEETCQWRSYDRGVLAGARFVLRKGEGEMTRREGRLRRSAIFTLGFSEACRHVRKSVNVSMARCRDWVHINARRLRGSQLGAFEASPDCLDDGQGYIPLHPDDQDMDSDGLEVIVLQKLCLLLFLISEGNCTPKLCLLLF